MPPLDFDSYNTKRVSYVLTTHNRVTFIENALVKLMPLVQENDELIVVDGGSTDGTLEILERFRPRIDYLISESDLSATHAYNKGILQTRGKYVKLVTDDDEYHGDAMEAAIRVMEENADIDILCCGGIRVVNGFERPVFVSPGSDYGKAPEDVIRFDTSGVGFLIRRKSLAKIGLWKFDSIASDGEFVARAIARGAKVRFCRLNLFWHPLHDHSATIAMAADHHQAVKWIVRRYCSRAFYLEFRLKEVASRYSWLLRSTRLLRDAARVLLRRPQIHRTHIHPDDIVWDGGFS